MKPLTTEDILDNKTFIAQRQAIQSKVAQDKAVRRIPLGQNMTWLFDNRLTVQWQIQEMCRVEGITGPAVSHEVETYNELLPTGNSLAPTLLVEYPDEAERKEMLLKLSGLSRHIHLVFEGAGQVPAQFLGDRETEEGKISSVQYVRFEMNEEQRAAFLSFSTPVALVVDHPHYQARTALTGAVRGALIEDLSAE